jgi:hypothetical protein
LALVGVKKAVIGVKFVILGSLRLEREKLPNVSPYIIIASCISSAQMGHFFIW